MRRITLWLLSTVTVVILLFSYRTSTSSSFASAALPVVQQATTASGASSSGSGSTVAKSKTTATSTQATTTKTYTGSTFYNQYGAVQVAITVSGGKITAAQAVQYPNGDPRSQEISAYAVPTLNSEAVQAQSSTIDMVSGASFTSYDYLQSLQSAIDQAHL